MIGKSKIKFIGLLAFFVLAAGMVHLLPDRPIGFVRKFKPEVAIQEGGRLQRVSKAEKLFSGDTLNTNKNGFALVQFIDNSIAKIKPNSQLIVQGEVNGKQNGSTRINVDSGELFLQVTKRSTTNFEVATNASVASVKGTQFGAREDNYFWVIEGVVEVRSKKAGDVVQLTKRMYGKVKDDGSIETGELTDEEIQKLQEDYDSFDEKLEPKVLKLRFRDKNGDIKTISLEYFENNS